MALLNEAMNEKKFDTRLIGRNVTRNVITSEEVDQNVKKLPDDNENADWVSIDTLVQSDSDKKH